MILLDSEQRAICRTQQFVFIHQFQSGIEIILVEEINRRLKRIAIQIVDFRWAACMVAAPNESRSPIAAMKRSVVLHRGRSAPDIRIWLLSLRTAKKTVRDLHGPIRGGHN